MERVVAGTAEVQNTAAKQASLLTRIASRYGVDRELVYKTLKDTAFRQRPDRKTGERRDPTNEEMVALLIIADQYGLNPFTRELYAFHDPKSGAIVAIVSIDGWIRIVNERPELAKIEFAYSEERTQIKNGKWAHEWVECRIYRTDREAPMVAREYFEEVFRGDKDFETPWDSHPKRFHRHKSFIQCARYAFGFAGIVDPDEGERIIEGEATRMSDLPPAIASINAKVQPPAAIENKVGQDAAPSGFELGEQKQPVERQAESKKVDKKTGETAKGGGPSYSEVRAALDRAKTADDIDAAEALVDGLEPQFQAELHALAKTRRGEIK